MMTQTRPLSSGEIDLIEFLRTLWDSKWIFCICITTATLLGVGYIFAREAVYESKISYHIDRLPPFSNPQQALRDVKEKFHSIEVFKEWKKNNDDSTLVFDDLSDTENREGYLFTKEPSKRLVTLQLAKKTGVLRVKSKDLNAINDVYNYVNHINELVTDEYLFRSNEESEFMKAQTLGSISVTADSLVALLSVDRYISNVKMGANTLVIQRPTIPKSTLSKPSLIIFVSAAIGGMLGVFIILILNITRARKNQLPNGDQTT